MASSHIERHRLVAGSLDDLGFQKFHEPPEEPPRTLDRVPNPDVQLNLEMAEGLDLELPFAVAGGLRRIRVWSIMGENAEPEYPSALIRVRQDQLFNASVITSKGPHTIHWHGIEPTPLNDGVGKHSFEIKEVYNYQWIARAPGFFFYHCHRNTPLHFELGLFGGLIIDPPQGEGWVATYNPPDHVVPYDVEAVWVLTGLDSRWHRLDDNDPNQIEHGHALLNDLNANNPASFTDDGILNDWRPDALTVNGAVARDSSTPITDPRVAVHAEVGQTVLLRILNANYAINEIRIGAEATIIAQDGRPYGVPPHNAYSAPVNLAPNTPFQINTAMRHDILVRPTQPGVIPVEVNYLDWRGYGSFGKALTTITVTGDPPEDRAPEPEKPQHKPPARPDPPAQPTPPDPAGEPVQGKPPARKPRLSLRERRRRARLAAKRRRLRARRLRARRLRARRRLAARRKKARLAARRKAARKARRRRRR